MRTSKEMPYHIGLVLRFYPSGYQKHIVSLNAGAQRKVYNTLVAAGIELYRLGKVKTYLKPVADRMDYLDSVRSSAMGIKTALPFLADKNIDSCVVGNGIRMYKAAWNGWRKNPMTGIPQFHKKSYAVSYQTDNHYTKDSVGVNGGSSYFCKKNKYFNVPKLGKVRISGSEKMIERVLNHKGDTRIATITVSRDATGRYYLSLAIASETPFVEKLPCMGNSVGIDMNLSNFFADSDGNIIPNPKYRRASASKLRKAERKLSLKAVRLKKEGRELSTASNYQKLCREVADMHRYASCRMDDFLHVLSKKTVKNHDLIFTENLKVRNMLHNSRLAFSISDVSWGRFFGMLAYKSDMYGRTYLKVPPHLTTQTCSCCGHVCRGSEHIRLGIEQWICPECGTYLVRDTNAAENIKARGLAMMGL